MKAWLFQGQGSQRKGMGAALFARFPEQVAEADRILGYSIERLCLEDPEQQLNLTLYTQPAIYVVSWLGYLAARENGEAASMAAGHSVGEYAALTAAGVLDFALGLRIVIERARLMAQVEGGGLMAVLGRDHDQVRQLLDELPDLGLAIANINSPRQIIVGGSHLALERLLAHCASQGIRALTLKVSGPFHTSHMQAAETPFRAFLQELSGQFRAPAFPVIANLDARPHRREQLVEALSRHLTHPVQWQQVLERLLAEGVEDFVEVGQPAILGDMLKDIREHAPPAIPKQPQGGARSLLVAALLPEHGGEALLAELARHGAIGLLDSRGLDDEQLRSTLERLKHNPVLSGRFGVSLSGAARLAWVAELGVRCIEFAASSLAADQWSALRKRWPTVHWLARLDHDAALDASLAGANALVIAADRQLPLLLEALARREQLPQTQRPLIGASGLIGTPASARAMFDLGVDFVMPGAVFLLSAEAAVPVGRQRQLAGLGRLDHGLLTDWRFPELASRSPGYVLDRAVSEQSEALQTFYLSAGGNDWPGLQAIVASFSAPLISATAPADGEVRRELHVRLQGALLDAQMPGDASLWLFNQWRQLHAPTLPIPLPAAQLLELLCPTSATPEAPTRKSS
ncbi:acyltransferase domain-containing protein [Pseudomonas stutzeri]|uniref:acyltransferase domain-containing protein n=1 Tax=Stutzerimonas stutzeri TaxID=316 RepID=UPI00210B6D0B|nr:acyltransferase domain-containing protein [Stutzerimonas stutzeri]MCQ4298184.1 acyltransferase domain-containing protein [Stutzerimonas stutzeri]